MSTKDERDLARRLMGTKRFLKSRDERKRVGDAFCSSQNPHLKSTATLPSCKMPPATAISGSLKPPSGKCPLRATRETRQPKLQMESDGMTHSTIARKLVSAIGACALLLSSALQPALACTGIRLIARTEPSFTRERSNSASTFIRMIVPRGYARTGTTPDGKDGIKWKAKYASVGLDGAGLPVLFDGVNEKGLATGIFYFPTSAGYMPYAPSDAGKTIAQWEVGSYILENFASVDEVRASIGNVVVPSVVFAGWGFAPEAHYIVHDPTGKTVVIEYVDGKLNIHDDPLGVITNSPNFDWHMTNLRNYVNFSMINVPPIKLGRSCSSPSARERACSGCLAISRRPRASFAPSPSASQYCHQRPDTTQSSRRSTSSTNSTFPRARLANTRRTSTVTWSQTIRSGRRRSISKRNSIFFARTTTARFE